MKALCAKLLCQLFTTTHAVSKHLLFICKCCLQYLSVKMTYGLPMQVPSSKHSQGSRCHLPHDGILAHLCRAHHLHCSRCFATITRCYGVEKLGYYITLWLHRIATYTHWKCYMGFCTSRRTVMDFKKKKKKGGDEVLAGIKSASANTPVCECFRSQRHSSPYTATRCGVWRLPRIYCLRRLTFSSCKRGRQVSIVVRCKLSPQSALFWFQIPFPH